jgi:hypothetical protein
MYEQLYNNSCGPGTAQNGFGRGQKHQSSSNPPLSSIFGGDYTSDIPSSCLLVILALSWLCPKQGGSSLFFGPQGSDPPTETIT